MLDGREMDIDPGICTWLHLLTCSLKNTNLRTASVKVKRTVAKHTACQKHMNQHNDSSIVKSEACLNPDSRFKCG